MAKRKNPLMIYREKSVTVYVLVSFLAFMSLGIYWLRNYEILGYKYIVGCFAVIVISMAVEVFKSLINEAETKEDGSSVKLGRVVKYNLAYGLSVLWFVASLVFYFLIVLYIFIFPLAYDAIYLYAIHILVFSLYFALDAKKSTGKEELVGMISFIFLVMLFFVSLMKIPYLSFYGASMLMEETKLD